VRRSSPSPFAIALLCGAVLLYQPLRWIVLTIIRFPLTVIESCTTAVVWLPQLPRLASENAALHGRLAAEQVELAQLREILRHAKQTQQLLQTAKSSSSVVASVIGRAVIPTQHVIILDKGAHDKVAVNSIVVSAEGVVGRVFEVHPTTSLAMLLSDPDSRASCLVERSRESGLLQGTGGGAYQLIYLDLDADIAVHDRIVTAGLGGPFPKGLVVGTVTRVIRDERTASVWAIVQPAVKLRQLEEVICLPPPSSSSD